MYPETSDIQQDLQAGGDSGDNDGPLIPPANTSSEMDRARDTWRICCSVSAGVAGVLCLILGVIVACIFDPLINSVIDKELVIKNDTSSEMYKMWVDPPIVPHLRIYFFNLTNSEDFMNLKVKPIFEEVGPYTYTEKWKKINVAFHANGTVGYQTKKEYYFTRSESVGSEEDLIHTLNVPVNVAVDRMVKMGRIPQLALSSILAMLNETAFVYKTVNQLVWGYTDPLIEVAKKYLPKDQQMPFDKFGFFYQRNGSSDGLFSVFTGADDMTRYTTIDTFNRSKELVYWKTSDCNKLNGTDGTAYPPNVKKSDLLYIFNENLCRSLLLKYNNTNSHNNIETFRFTTPADIFANSSVKPENECFCVGDMPCPGGGLFNIGPCKYNASSFLSWPHFYQADKKHLDAVIGLNPDPLKHSLYFDVNPKLGMPLAVQVRLQINFWTINTPHVKQVANITPMFFPVLWFEDGVDSMPPKILSLVEKAYFVPLVLKSSILSVLFVGGFLLLIVGIVRFVQHRRNTSNFPIAKEKADFANMADSGHVNPVVSAENPD